MGQLNSPTHIMQRSARTAGRLLLLSALCLAFAACTGDFDQRQEQAKTQGAGSGSSGTVANPNGGAFVRGTVSIGGSVRNAFVTLRRVNVDGSIDWDDTTVLGTGLTFDNGIYQLTMRDDGYRGPILIEARGGSGVIGGNPASALSQKFHDMQAVHVIYGAVPYFDGYSIDHAHVTPLTSVAVARGLSFDGTIAGVPGGLATGMFGLMSEQVAEFFGLSRIRAKAPLDYAASGFFGNSDFYGRVMAALSQLARDIGVSNVFDFHLGLYQDALDDGELNGSIAVVPNTPISMPDLGAPGVLGAALFNNYMAPGNLERAAGGDNTQVAAGSALETLINTLDSARDIDDAVRGYDLTVRMPGTVTLDQGDEFRTRIAVLHYYGGGTDFECYGDSAGPSFIEFVWTSSSPANVSVQNFGRITVAGAAPQGTYTISLTIRPAIGQTFVTGPTESHSITVKVK